VRPAGGRASQGDGVEGRRSAACGRGWWNLKQGEAPALSTSVFDRVQEVVANELGVDLDKVTPDAEFQDDLNADSLDLVELIMKLEEEFDITITDEEAEKISKVSDAVEFIEERLGQ
jgi:acyl carrier protein